ncbi:hypothetical protein [Streptomyces sp. NPDC047928]|uniref:hypothetical protein n=1 Tax=unclassified Streptomyces TaxID=2593676 RepID=UPI0037107527
MTTTVTKARDTAFTAAMDAVLHHHSAFMEHALLVSDSTDGTDGAFVHQSSVCPLPGPQLPLDLLNRMFPDAPTSVRGIWGDMLKQLDNHQRSMEKAVLNATGQLSKDGDTTAWKRALEGEKRELRTAVDASVRAACEKVAALARDNPKWHDYILSWTAEVVGFTTDVVATVVNFTTYTARTGAKDPERTQALIESFFTHSRANVDHWVLSNLTVIDRPVR